MEQNKNSTLKSYRGYYGIGIEGCKKSVNIGTLWRSAESFGAAFIFTIGNRYKTQKSDTIKATRHIPLYEYEDFSSFYGNIPKDCTLIGVENLSPCFAYSSFEFCHPERAIYLLGAEDKGLSAEASINCYCSVYIPSKRCLNVSIAGSIILYDRLLKGKAK